MIFQGRKCPLHTDMPETALLSKCKATTTSQWNIISIKKAQLQGIQPDKFVLPVKITFKKCQKVRL